MAIRASRRQKRDDWAAGSGTPATSGASSAAAATPVTLLLPQSLTPSDEVSASPIAATSAPSISCACTSADDAHEDDSLQTDQYRVSGRNAAADGGAMEDNAEEVVTTESISAQPQPEEVAAAAVVILTAASLLFRA